MKCLVAYLWQSRLYMDDGGSDNLIMDIPFNRLSEVEVEQAKALAATLHNTIIEHVTITNMIKLDE